MNSPAQPIVELRFNLTACSLPADHGYIIFSALCTLLPDLRINEVSIPGLSILPIPGRNSGQRRLAPLPQSQLAFRLPLSHVSKLLPLAGKSLPIPGNGSVALGTPSVAALNPASSLYSRLVTIKVRNVKENAARYYEHFLTSARRMVGELGVKDDQLSLVPRKMAVPVEGGVGSRTEEPWVRRTLTIKRQVIVGYALVARNLDPEASLALQAHGIGGRRHFGCGVFVNHDSYE